MSKLGRTVALVSMLLFLGATLADAGPAAAAHQCFGAQATIVGTNGADDIEGTSGADVIVGLGGSDRIRGLGGADLICGGPGSDRMRGGSGDDRLQGGGAYEGGRNALHGGPGDDTLLGAGANDDFWPEAGDDFVRGGDSYGLDVVHYENATASMHVDLRAKSATGQGTDILRGIKDVVGSPQADVIAGSDGPGRDQRNTLEGNGGADLLLGRGGGDFLVDGLVGGAHSSGADVLRGGPRGDILELGSGNDQAFGGPGRDGFSVRGTGKDLVRGGPGPDKLSFGIGPVQASLLTGQATTPLGKVTFSSIRHLQGSGRADTLIGNASGNDIIGGAGNDLIDGRGGNDVLWGWGANDTLLGRAGNDTLEGTFGDDQLDGGTGTDTAEYGSVKAVTIDLAAGTATGYGTDSLTAVENVRIVGTSETDQILLGDDGPNVLEAGPGNDTVGGRDGDDTLVGHAGDDSLDGGLGNDTAFGGSGMDTCISMETPHSCEA